MTRPQVRDTTTWTDDREAVHGHSGGKTDKDIHGKKKLKSSNSENLKKKIVLNVVLV